MIDKNMLNLYSDDEKVNEILEKLKLQHKIYTKILKTLQLIGDFNSKINIELYEKKQNDVYEYVKACFSDINDNIFIICLYSTNSSDLSKIEKITNNQHLKYDIALAKKYILSEQNINLIQTDEVYNFKFGRLITNKRSFFSLFLGDDICYQISINFGEQVKSKNILPDEILSKLNKMEKRPILLEFVGIINELLSKKNSSFKEIKISAFKNFEMIGKFTINDTNNSVNNKKVRERGKHPIDY